MADELRAARWALSSGLCLDKQLPIPSPVVQDNVEFTFEKPELPLHVAREPIHQ